MANLLEIAELAHRQLFPNPSNIPTIKREEFIATARAEYAYQTVLKFFTDKRAEGFAEIPSILLDEEEFEVDETNELDLSDARVMRGFPNDAWLQNVGGVGTACGYIKTSANLWQVLFDDDSIGDSKPYYAVGQLIKFPLGIHGKKVKVIFAGAGKRVNSRIEVDDAIAGLIRTKLVELYGGKTGQEDASNNGNTTK